MHHSYFIKQWKQSHRYNNSKKINNIKHLHRTYAKQCCKHFWYMNIFNPPDNLVKYVWLISLFYTWENRCTEWLSELPEFTKQVWDWVTIQTHTIWLQNWVLHHLTKKRILMSNLTLPFQGTVYIYTRNK